MGSTGTHTEHEVAGVRVRISAGDAALMAQAETRDFEPYSLYLLNHQAQEIALRPSFDTLISPELAQGVTPYKHQLETVRRALSRMRGRALLCDEVGLGKTIEAGLILLELTVRGLARSVLVLTPAGLVAQWREEMSRKFRLEFATTDDEAFRAAGAEAWRRHDRVIASLPLVKREPHASAILSREFDVVIVDEAHHVRNRATVGWRFVREVRKRYAFLLTATPVQNHLEELHNLVTLLSPGLLGTLREFRQQHLQRGDPLAPRDAGGLRELLGEAMIRNRRSTSGVRFTRRYATTLRIEPSEEERALYGDVSRRARELYRSGVAAARMVGMTLQMELGSTPLAAAPTLRKIGEGQLAERAQRLQRPRKLARLVELVRDAREKMIVFTRFHGSIEAIVSALGEAGIAPAVYRGGLTRRERDAAIARFRDEAPVLVSSEAGGEGRNLQFCSTVVNFDLPWNPMRIEQRIGRVSRIGQERDVYVWNLCSAGTLEERLLHLLEAKIHLFELVVGEIDMILGQMREERSFEEVLMELWARAEGEREFEVSLDELGQRLVAAKEEYVRAREVDDRLFADALRA